MQFLLHCIGRECCVGNNGRLNQGFAVARAHCHICSECAHQPPCGRLDHDQLAVKNAADCMVCCQGEVSRRVQKCIDSGRDCAAAAVSQDDDKAQIALQVFNGVSQAAKYIATQAIAGNSDYEQVIRALTKDQFNGHPRVRAAEHRRKRLLAGGSRVGKQAKVLRIDVNRV